MSYQLSDDEYDRLLDLLCDIQGELQYGSDACTSSKATEALKLVQDAKYKTRS